MAGKHITPESMRKLIHRIERSSQVDPSLQDVARFVVVKHVKVSRGDSGRAEAHIICNRGLQIQNTVYFLDGSIQLVKAGSSGIVAETCGIPSWADERLRTMYTAFCERRKERTGG